MRHSGGGLLCGLMTVLLVSGLAGCATRAQRVRVGPEERRVSVTLLGNESPLVVLESGLGRGQDVWASVLPLLRGRVGVLAYDRAGIGGSDDVDGPKSAGRAADELGALLDTLEVNGPVVLVGHSYGGLVVRLLATRRPELVAGVVLVDATHEAYPDFEARFESRARASKRETELSMAPAAARAERDGLRRSVEEIREAAPLPPLPLVVLSAGGRRGPIRLEEEWERLQLDLAGLSPRGRRIVVRDAGHELPFEAPAAVAQAVLDLVSELDRGAMLNSTEDS